MRAFTIVVVKLLNHKIHYRSTVVIKKSFYTLPQVCYKYGHTLQSRAVPTTILYHRTFTVLLMYSWHSSRHSLFFRLSLRWKTRPNDDRGENCSTY